MALDEIQQIIPEQKKFYERGYFFIIFCCIFIFSIFAFKLGIIFPPSFDGQKNLIIQPGDRVQDIANTLQQDGIMQSPLFLLIYLKLINADRKIKPGSYYFNKPISIPRIVYMITSDLAERKIRIHEGWTNFEIASYLENDGIVVKKDFLSVAIGTEGYLFPDTYQIFQNTSAPDLIKKMRNEFDKKIEPLLPEIERKKIPLKDIVIMASLIEKESAGEEDRAIISGILWKRFKNGRPLQVDATLSYLLGKESKDLTTDDLKTDSPYNTYKYPGLPIGPIGNPGLDAIKATIYPKDSLYWFYLHDKNGNAYFAKTFEEHIANKNKYLR
ncbi:MAG: endolytic transglycosylase MltG [Patescibacteria group bacterium]